MKKFLILNNQDEVIGSYEAEEKDETSNSRSYLLCPPHARHVEVEINVDLPNARAVKLEEIRNQRDAKLVENDKAWLIAAKKREDTTNLETAAQMLRDMPEHAAAELEELSTVEEISSYSPFGV